MSNESFNSRKNNSESLAKKQQLWDKKMAEMLISDGYGYVLDAGIRNAVVALQLLGFNTTQSDQGNYSDSPWVEVGAPDPRSVYEEEDELKAQLMAAHAVRPEEIDPSSPLFSREKQVEIEGTARRELASRNAPFTSEYEEWHAKTLQYAKDLHALIDEFYKLQPAEQQNPSLRVSIDFPYRTPNHSRDIQDVPFLCVVFNNKDVDEMKEEDRHQRVVHAQQEMGQFADYLKSRFFSS